MIAKLAAAAAPDLRVLLIAEANLHRHGNWPPLWPEPAHSYGARLMRLLDISRDEYLKRFDRMNLCGYQWRAFVAHRLAETVVLRVPEAQVIAVFGPRVTHAFDLNYVPFTAKGRFRILPHLGKGARTGWEFESNIERTRQLLGL